MSIIENVVDFLYNLLWGDLLVIPLPGGQKLGISLLVLLLVPAGVYFTIRTKFLPIRKFPEMLRIVCEKEEKKGGLTGWQSLIISTATRVGMGNLAGVVVAISAGGAGAIFWMWITALIGSATAFIEATLSQKYNEDDPIYGGKRGGPAYYIHAFMERLHKRKIKKSVIAVLFAISALICFSGISQVVGNSVTEAFNTAFDIDPIYTIIALVIISAVIVLKKNASVKVLDIIVPVMAGGYFLITIILLIMNFDLIPGIFGRIIREAFGLRQVVAGGFGAVLMNGVKRGLFSNEAGSGSAPCATASAITDHPAKIGLLQSLGVLIDTLVICSCTALIILMVPSGSVTGLKGMTLLQGAMDYHLGGFGVVFIAITLWLFAFSTFIGTLYYARSNVSYIFGDKKIAQTGYKLFALIMLFIGGIAAFEMVWTIGDIGIALMTVFNIVIILLMCKEALILLKDYEKKRKKPEQAVVEKLIERGWHISFAESCTGGLAAAKLVSVADASRVLDASVVTYANEAKIAYLDVSASKIEQYGVVSEQIALEMALGVAKRNKAEVGIGISGIAGPGGGTASKPVGTVCFGFVIGNECFSATKHFKANGRNYVRKKAVDFVYETLIKKL